MSLKWAHDGLFQSPIYYCLVTNAKDYARALKDGNVHEESAEDFDAFPRGCVARVCWYGPGSIDDDTATTCAIVCVHPDLEKKTPIEQAGVLVHEAVHIWQRICLVIDEKDPGIEIEAYSVQWISMNLMHLWTHRRG